MKWDGRLSFSRPILGSSEGGGRRRGLLGPGRRRIPPLGPTLFPGVFSLREGGGQGRALGDWRAAAPAGIPLAERSPVAPVPVYLACPSRALHAEAREPGQHPRPAAAHTPAHHPSTPGTRNNPSNPARNLPGFQAVFDAVREHRGVKYVEARRPASLPGAGIQRREGKAPVAAPTRE